ncbi:hypothetical protein RHGRI_024274 [Rhododendron griersonianum]|uniref:Uncharacterized protein n=1 Tax=Rhododendron griersonianum TaxID=479676 RepID=A0AAV6J6X9_9ERIC|nr:hypothetical protein RHGRI_024274 [Rhododendron griersonianum]
MKLLYFPSNLTGIHLYGRDELEIEISSLDPEKTVPWLTVKKCGIKLIYEDEEHILLDVSSLLLETNFEIPEIVARNS